MTTHRSLGYFDARFDSAESAEPRYRYAIVSSPRTGSNYLCARLNNLKDRLGMPMEYLHPEAFGVMGARLFPGVAGKISLESYLDAVARVRTTCDGWFGAKIQPNQLFTIFNGDINKAIGFLKRFDRLIFMTRRDKLGQAISGAIADATGVWFNFGHEPNLDGIDVAQMFPQIALLEMQYVEEEKLIGAISSRLEGNPLLHIAYEDILQNPQEVFQGVVSFFGFDGAAGFEERVTTPPTQKPAGALAGRIRASYLDDLARRKLDTAHTEAGPVR